MRGYDYSFVRLKPNIISYTLIPQTSEALRSVIKEISFNINTRVCLNQWHLLQNQYLIPNRFSVWIQKWLHSTWRRLLSPAPTQQGWSGLTWSSVLERVLVVHVKLLRLSKLSEHVPLFVLTSVYQSVWPSGCWPAGDAASHNSSTTFDICNPRSYSWASEIHNISSYY